MNWRSQRAGEVAAVAGVGGIDGLKVELRAGLGVAEGLHALQEGEHHDGLPGGEGVEVLGGLEGVVEDGGLGVEEEECAEAVAAELLGLFHLLLPLGGGPAAFWVMPP